MWQWRTLHLQEVLVQEEHGCARQMADSSGWSSERKRERSSNEAAGKGGTSLCCAPGKKSGSCCPLNAVQGSEVVENRDRHGPDDLSAKDITLAVV